MNPDLARLVFPEYRFGKTRPEEGEKLAAAGVGGFCFYGGTAEEVAEASRRLRAAADGPLLIAADYEDGAGRWVKGATELPSNMAIGASGSEALARRKGEIAALEARALGVDWLFAPVLDLAVRPGNPIVNVRSFGADPDLVSRLGAAFAAGANAQGALCCFKHFPGHGETEADSHLELPTVALSEKELERDLKPFRGLAAGADSVMVGHLRVPALDPDNPASLSRAVIHKLLRAKLGFEGVVITDALDMKALAGTGEPGLRALLAGADALLFPEDPWRLLAALDQAEKDGVVRQYMADQALMRQEELHRRLASYRRGLPPAGGGLRCEEHLLFPGEAAPACLAWAAGPGRFLLKAGERAGYLEPGTAPSEWKGRAFLATLEALGVKAEPYRPGLKLAAGVFSRPRAYSGAIGLAEKERAELAAAIASSAGAAVCAFGSPFVLNGLKPAAALCAFSALEDFQACAAGALAGQIKISGSLPVKLEL